MSIDGIGSMPPMGPPPGVKPLSATEMSNEIISAKDTDADGALSVEESGLTQETFDVLDTNEDGVVSQDELVAALTEKLEAMKENMPPMGPPPMGPPPEKSTDETEDSTELDRLVEMLNEVGTSMNESAESGANMYTMVLQELGVSSEDQVTFFEILENNGLDYKA